MATLLQDIRKGSKWIIECFAAENMKLDYTIDSFKHIDRFFDEQSKDGEPVPGGVLSSGTGAILFSLGAYVGETIIKNTKGSTWVTNDKDPRGEINIAVKRADGTLMWPVQRVMKRLKNGAEDDIWSYGMVSVKDDPFEHTRGAEGPTLTRRFYIKTEKKWWQFWK
jgi:hypothetical protein